MSWFNIYGLIIMTIIMIPNIIFAITNKEGFENKYKNRIIETFEEIGRFGCFALMIINIPYLCTGFWFKNGRTIYIVINAILCFLYCLFWIICWKQNGIFKALTLSILPSVMFICSGIIIMNVPLIFLSVIFAICHITISYKNAVI